MCTARLGFHVPTWGKFKLRLVRGLEWWKAELPTEKTEKEETGGVEARRRQ